MSRQMRGPFHPFHRHVMPWAVWGIAALFVFYQFLIQASPGVMVPELIRSFQIDAFKVSVLSAMYFIPYVLLQMPAGALVDRFGARRLLVTGMIGCSVMTLVFALSQWYWLANTSRMFTGLFAAPGIVACLYLAGRWFPPQRFALLIGLTETVGMLGAAIGEPSLSIGLHTSLGWRGAMLICAILGIVLTVVAWFLVRDKPSWQTDEFPANEPPKSKLNFWQTLMAVLRLPSAWLLGFYTGLAFAAINMFAALWSIPYLEAYYQLDETTASFITSLIYWGAAIGAPLFGWLSERMGRRKPLMWFGAFGTFVCVTLVLYGPRLPLYDVVAAYFLIGILCSSYMLSFAVMRDITRENLRATAMGFTNMFCSILGGIFMQPLAGLLLEYKRAGHVVKGVATYTLQDYHFALSILPIGMLIAFFLVFFIPETYCRSWQVKPAEFVDATAS